LFNAEGIDALQAHAVAAAGVEPADEESAIGKGDHLGLDLFASAVGDDEICARIRRPLCEADRDANDHTEKTGHGGEA
jgi:hypothetical protein